MAGSSKEEGRKKVTLAVSTAERPKFKGPVAAYVFSAQGELLETTKVTSGKVGLGLSEAELSRARVFLAPEEGAAEPTVAQLERRGAYEPVLANPRGKGLIDLVEIPGGVIDGWPLCSCWVRGRVLRASDNRAVCGARVHVCEVDRVPSWISGLPEYEVIRLRDDLIGVLGDPIQAPLVTGPVGPIPGPDPDPAPIAPRLFRFDAGSEAGYDPQPDPPAASRAVELEPRLRGRLLSPSATVVRAALAENWHLVYPWLCHWRHWWWRFECDELRTVTTDAHGRFETRIWYLCAGDRPDLYFWVEYDFGQGFETVYRPPIACHTHWDYACGTEVTIRAADARLPGCGGEPDLPGCQVVVLSIGNGVAVREVQTGAANPNEGLTHASEPFGGTLEPRVDFSRSQLIDVKNVPYYRWSYWRLSGPDGGPTVDPSSVPIPDPAQPSTPLTRAVYRHYKVGTSYPSEPMGPVPAVGGTENLFRIRPVNPPAGGEWVVLDQHVDLATGYFETAALAGAPAGGPSPGGPAPVDLAAGRYELRLELFDAAGNLVNWTARGIDLRITAQDAPFGTGTVHTVPAPGGNRIRNAAGDTLGFRMVLRVDNNRCYAEIRPVAGDLTPDPQCGFHRYAPGDDAGLSFVARHPNGFATYAFTTARATGAAIGAASTSGVPGRPGNDGFTQVGAFTYAKDVPVSTLLGACANAAFSERLDVSPTATDGYGTLSGYHHADTAAFALAQPCPPCECEEGDA